MEKETETNERNKNWSYFKFNNILSTLRNQQWHRIICVQCSNALLFRLPISKRREWDYKWNRRKKNRITKTRTKNIHNLSWRASHFLQFNSCIMSMLVEKKSGAVTNSFQWNPVAIVPILWCSNSSAFDEYH